MLVPKRVFPVPGGPHNSTPPGNLAFILVNFCGSLRMLTTSSNSKMALPTPATSLKLVVY